MPPHQPRPGRSSPQGAGELTPEPSAGESRLAGGRIARHTLFSALGEGSNALLFLVGFLAARSLGPTEFGQYTTAAAFVGLFRVLPDFGMAYASTLRISRDPSQAGRLTGGLLGFQAFLSAATIALCLLLGREMYAGTTWLAVAILSFDLILKSVKFTLRFLLKSLELFAAESLSLLAERAGILVFGAWVLWEQKGLVAFALVFLVVRFVDVAGLWSYVHARVVPLRPSGDRALWLDLLRKGLPFAYAGLVMTLIFQLDAVLLERLRGPQEVGWYRPPTFVLEGLTLVPRILGYALIPLMASLHGTEPRSVTALYSRGCKYLLLVGLPIGMFGWLASDRFLPFLFGTAYGPSVTASRILLPAAVLMFLSNFSETTLACIDRWRWIVAASTTALLLNVVLNLLWIPAQGYLGASKATLATEAFYFLATAAAVAASGHRISWPGLVLRPLASAGVFGFALWLGRGWPLVLSAAVASCAWFGATLALRVWDGKERAAVRELWQGHAPDPRRLA
jgi:O-antigen/teichoic acid export membrane protein